MTKPDWSPAQYERFKDQRSKPFFDLLAMVEPKPQMRAVDLGAGTGELTRTLHQTLACRATTGVDSSPAMLDKARAFAGEGLSFIEGDLASFGEGQQGSFDLVFSNAAIHWTPNHPALLARLRALLAPGGQLAVQVPANHDHPSHIVAAEVAQEAPFASALTGYTRQKPILDPDEYATILYDLGFVAQRVLVEVYAHVLGEPRDVVEWVKGTLLTDYQKRMPADLYPRFLARYEEALLPRLRAQKPYFYPFKRLLFWAKAP